MPRPRRFPVTEDVNHLLEQISSATVCGIEGHQKGLWLKTLAKNKQWITDGKKCILKRTLFPHWTSTALRSVIAWHLKYRMKQGLMRSQICTLYQSVSLFNHIFSKSKTFFKLQNFNKMLNLFMFSHRMPSRKSLHLERNMLSTSRGCGRWEEVSLEAGMTNGVVFKGVFHVIYQAHVWLITEIYIMWSCESPV